MDDTDSQLSPEIWSLRYDRQVDLPNLSTKVEQQWIPQPTSSFVVLADSTVFPKLPA